MRAKNLGHDITAGVVVFLIALPLCLGIAFASHAPLVAGIISGIVGGILVGALSGSHTSVSGPAAGLTTMVAVQIGALGSFDVFLVALIIAGLVQIIMGLARVGFIAAFFPTSVIKGLLAAIGIILILKQLPHLTGLDMDYWGDLAFWQIDQENTFSELTKILSLFHGGATIVGLLSLVLLISYERFELSKKLRIPAPLFVVLFGTLLSMFLPDLIPALTIEAEHRVQIPVISSLSELGKLVSLPNFSALWRNDVFIAGVSIALVASLETLLNLEAVDRIDPQQRKSPPNRELIAQGIGNLLLGFIGGLPVTSVVIRSSVNINAQAKTKRATIFHGCLLLISVIAFPFIINAIPLACLAAILIVTGLKLASPKIFKHMWAQGLSQFCPFLITILAIVFTDLLSGVFIGFAASLVFILHRNLQGPVQINKENYLGREVSRLILPAHVSFLNKATLVEALNSLPNSSHVIIDADDTEHIDADVLDVLKDFRQEGAPARDILVTVVGLKDYYLLASSTPFNDHATRELQKTANPESVLEIIKKGNQRTLEGRRLKRDLNRQIRATATGQFPIAAFLSCIDSRVPVELIFDLGIGDAFSIRMAGNVVSKKVIGSIEFACAVAGAKMIVIVGHTNCGAIAAAVDSWQTGTSIQKATGCNHLGSIVKEIQHVIPRSESKVSAMPNNSREELINTVIRENILASIEAIQRESPIICQLLEEKRIGIAGCVYNIASGKVEFLDIPIHPIGEGPSHHSDASFFVQTH